MSGECYKCGEHCLDCRCDNIKVWAQMFFDDGSVSESKRVNSAVFDDQSNQMLRIAIRLLESVNRDEGLLVVWGAGEMFNRYYYFPKITSSST
jgi:hypothetical protein